MAPPGGALMLAKSRRPATAGRGSSSSRWHAWPGRHVTAGRTSAASASAFRGSTTRRRVPRRSCPTCQPTGPIGRSWRRSASGLACRSGSSTTPVPSASPSSGSAPDAAARRWSGLRSAAGSAASSSSVAASTSATRGPAARSATRRSCPMDRRAPAAIAAASTTSRAPMRWRRHAARPPPKRPSRQPAAATSVRSTAWPRSGAGSASGSPTSS